MTGDYSEPRSRHGRSAVRAHRCRSTPSIATTRTGVPSEASTVTRSVELDGMSTRVPHAGHS